MPPAVNLEPSGILQLCPGSNITFSCTNNQSAVIAWRAFDENHPDGNPIFFSTFSVVDMRQLVSGIFTVTLQSLSPLVLTATLTNSFNPQQNGTLLFCSNTVSSTPSPSQMEIATLLLRGNFQCSMFLACVRVCMGWLVVYEA